MKKILFLGSLFISGIAWAVPPVVSPSTPIVNQGGTIQFTADAAGSWACSGTTSTGGVKACSGSINSGTGLYTAPSSVTAQHIYAGMQILPNNHVYNVRIDSLPVHALNATWFAAANIGGTPHFTTDFPINYVTPQGSTTTMYFNYTSGNNGTFEIPKFPNAKAEHGWYNALQFKDADHHIIMVDTVSKVMSETYQYYPNCRTIAASVTANVATLTCSESPSANGFFVGSTVVVGGFTGSDTYFNGNPFFLTSVTPTSISYALTHANASASTNGAAGKNWVSDSTGLMNSASGIKYENMISTLPPISTDAAGMQLQPLILGYQEMEQAYATGGNINHAFRNTFGIGVEASSNVWPASTFASDGNVVPFGTRLRLKSNFDISGYSTIAQIQLRALQRYGTFNTDGGNNWPMNAERTRWSKTFFDALRELDTAGRSFAITNTVLSVNVATVTANNDFVGGLSIVTVTGTTNGSGAFNAENVRVTSATPTQFSYSVVHANVGSASDTGTAFSPLSNYMEFVDESSIMISTFSGLTKYNREIVTFTRTSDSSTTIADVALQGPAVNMLNDVMYLMAGTSAQQLIAFNNYGGTTWTMSPTVGSLTSGGLYSPPSFVASATTATITATSIISSSVAAQMSITVFPSTGIYVIPSKTSNYTDTSGNVWNSRTGYDLPDYQGCCACDNASSFPAITDVSLWSCVVGVSSDYGGDTHMDFVVPNGLYQVVYHYGSQYPTGSQFMKYTVGTSEVYPNVDPSAQAGGQFKIFSSTNTLVTNNLLQVGIWGMNETGAPVSSLGITPVISPPTITSEVFNGNIRISGGVTIR